MKNKIEIYQTQDGKTEIEVKWEEETVWLTQEQMALLLVKTKVLAFFRLQKQANSVCFKHLVSG
ncbi:MAG: hypothetical protein N3A69_00730 [Leptospiraceae bacterium]|nr:hypothetical protein [Leptospiraceae bacterium]